MFKDEEVRKSKGARGFAAKTRNNSILNNSTPRNHIYIFSVHPFSTFFKKETLKDLNSICKEVIQSIGSIVSQFNWKHCHAYSIRIQSLNFRIEGFELRLILHLIPNVEDTVVFIA